MFPKEKREAGIHHTVVERKNKRNALFRDVVRDPRKVRIFHQPPTQDHRDCEPKMPKVLNFAGLQGQWVSRASEMGWCS